MIITTLQLIQMVVGTLVNFWTYQMKQARRYYLRSDKDPQGMGQLGSVGWQTEFFEFSLSAVVQLFTARTDTRLCK